MRLSTSTNILFNRPLGEKETIEKCITMCSKAGYRVMDMNFHDCTTFETPFKTKEWEKWINNLKQVADDCNIEFSQAHSPFYNFCEYNSERELYDNVIKRAVICSEILGVEWLVIHAGTDFSSPQLVKDSKRKNIEYFKPLIEFAGKHNVGIAIENLWDLNISPLRRYTTTSEELVDLVDSLNYKNLGICWDVEHANIMKQEQLPALQLIGKRLKATHISDNIGKDDDHILPYSGHTNWEEIMSALKEINYKGDFTYEIHRYTERVPDELVLSALIHSVNVGNHLLSLA
ncbi:hypothetical protein AN1V17_23470 [Vallitalea sediminicola]